MPKACESLGVWEQASVTREAICHRAKFVNEKGLSLVSRALLFEEYRSSNKDADIDRSCQNDRRKNDECDKCKCEIEKTLAKRHTGIITNTSEVIMIYGIF